VASAQEGLQTLRTARVAGEPFDMVLLDYQMPEMTGLDFLRVLRSEPSLKETKCIVLSSMGDRQSGVDHLDVAAWLNKPVRQAQLYSAVAMVAGVSAGWNAKGVPVAVREISRDAGLRAEARVLLVEDNAVNQQVAKRMLAAFGLNAQLAVNGLEALSRIQQESFDLVLMDCQMPVMDGYEATGRIRAWELEAGRERLPIVAMTANAMEGDREVCLAAGMDDYLAKPIKRDMLRIALTRWIGVEPPTQTASVTAPELLPNVKTLDDVVFEQLRELFDNDVTDVIESYLQDSLEHIEGMTLAANTGERDVLKINAHSLKSSSRALGAMQVSALAEQLEQLATGTGSMDEIKVIVGKMRWARTAAAARLMELNPRIHHEEEARPRRSLPSPN
jgi:CheY-like chemotaxis protein